MCRGKVKKAKMDQLEERVRAPAEHLKAFSEGGACIAMLPAQCVSLTAGRSRQWLGLTAWPVILGSCKLLHRLTTEL